MRLRTKLIASMLLFTFALTVVLSLVFLSEVVRERIAQTDAANDVLVHQVLASTRTALQQGMRDSPPDAPGEAAFELAVQRALQNSSALAETLDGFVRYSASMEDAFVSSADGRVLVSSNPAMVGQPNPQRRGFREVGHGSLNDRRRILFGAPETLDVSLPLQRNGKPFLTAHLGLRSTFLRNAYAPWLRDAVLLSGLALGGALLVAAALSAAALRPIEKIGRDLEVLSSRGGRRTTRLESGDAVARVSSTISQIDEQMRTSEQTHSEMASNLNSMLQTLKDGVMLFSPDMRVAMASGAIQRFLPAGTPIDPGTPITEIFPPGSAIGTRLTELVAAQEGVREEPVALPEERTVAMSLDFFPAGDGFGALLTLHDAGAQEELEREIEVARRMASIGRLTAGVGHEVKNPINAMVVHLELLRGKLASGHNDGAQRHVDVLASEMSRLDRVVQALADFSRPLEPNFREQELLPIVEAVVNLIEDDARSRGIAPAITCEDADASMRILCDAELLRQALLNVALNAMQAMPEGGVLHFDLSRERQGACLSIRDTGMGIAPDKLGRIFDLYFTTKPTGSGIGLAMTYRIVQLHGGFIQVRSDSDPSSFKRGTMFTFRLPLAGRSNHHAQVAAVTA